MRFLHLIVLAWSLLPSLAAPTPITIDFSGGLGSGFSVRNDNSLWNVGSDSAGLRISKQADDGSQFIDYSTPNDLFTAGGLESNFAIDGDFAVTVDFVLYDFQVPSFGGGINSSILGVRGTQGEFWDLRFALWNGSQSIEAFDTAADSPIGQQTNYLSQGQYRITRVGSDVSAFFAWPGDSSFSLLGTATSDLTGPVTLLLLARQGQNPNSANFSGVALRGALDVSFNNLVIEADRVVTVPEPTTLSLLGAGVLAMCLRRRRTARSLLMRLRAV